jgi:hypothetical protein
MVSGTAAAREKNKLLGTIVWRYTYSMLAIKQTLC